MRVRTLATLALAASLGVQSCDDSEVCQVKASNGKTYDCDPDAPQKCELFLTQYCDRVAECSWFLSESSCKAQVATQIDCSTAEAVTESYEGCLADIQNFACGALEDALPTSFQGAVLASPGSGGGNTEPEDDDTTEPEPEPDTSEPTIWDSTYSMINLSITVANYKPSGDNWDALGGAPDILINFYLDGEFLGASSTRQDTFDGSWSDPGVSLVLSPSSKLLLEVLDEDLTANDSINDVTIQGSQLKNLMEDGWLSLNAPAESIESLELSLMAE